jgi:8-oxo-dGTP pyrophosphatase MutT (NUDIX family)
MAPATPSLAATLMLVRDRGALEVLMVERHADMRFGPGALVFPGGKLDAQDVDPAWSAYALGWAELDDEARGLRICAIRETFEETGILVAYGLDGQDGNAAEIASGLRSAVAFGDLPFLEVIKTAGLRLDLHALVSFARWVTPTRQPIRFDAAFFIAPAPQGQAAVCDEREIVAADWLRPAEALDMADMEQRKLMRPTRANLLLLAADACVSEALANAGKRPVVTIRQED